MLPLLQIVAQWLEFHASEDIILEQFSFLKENEEFIKVYNIAVDYGFEPAMEELNNIKKRLIKQCRKHKEFAKAATKGIFGYIISKTVAKTTVKLLISTGNMR